MRRYMIESMVLQCLHGTFVLFIFHSSDIQAICQHQTVAFQCKTIIEWSTSGISDPTDSALIQCDFRYFKGSYDFRTDSASLRHSSQLHWYDTMFVQADIVLIRHDWYIHWKRMNSALFIVVKCRVLIVFKTTLIQCVFRATSSFPYLDFLFFLYLNLIKIILLKNIK